MASNIVTVFGGSGFLGRHVVRALARDGWRIRVAVRYPELAGFVRTAGMVGNVQPIKADVTDEASVSAAIAGSNAVVNLVGIMHGGARLDAVNEVGAGRIARLAAQHGVQSLVHISALGTSAESGSRYARSKAAGEVAVREAFPDAVILRPSVLFGPEDAFYNRFANMARFSLALPLIGGGATKFQPVYAGDVADAVAAVLAGKGEAGATYDLGGPAVMSFKDIMEQVLRLVGRRRALVPLPFGIARIIAFPASLVPGKPLTPDQVELLKSDSVVAEGTRTFADLGLQPEAADAIVPTYIWRFRKTGQFTVVEN